MNVWKCPVCNEVLISNQNNRNLVCLNRHQFDVAKQGYVNLLQSQKSKLKQRGDEKNMVIARQRYLDSGKYEVFRNKLMELLEIKETDVILDCGCGEGYYAQTIKNHGRVYGIDISKDAIIQAKKRNPLMNAAVASTFNIPVCNEAIDKAYCVFAPFDVNEIIRVLKPGGIFIEVFPLENHLFELKEVLYQNAYRNEVANKGYDGFDFLALVRCEGVVVLESQALIQDLFTMTPYYHRTPKLGVENLQSLNQLQTSIGFAFAMYRKQ